jgi:hypothetical protein
MVKKVSLERRHSFFKTSIGVYPEEFGEILATRLSEAYANQGKETWYEGSSQGASVAGG